MRMPPPILCLFALFSAVSLADELVLVKPGGEGSNRRARRFVEEWTGYLAPRMGVGLSGAYYNDLGEALDRLREERPTHGIVGLDVYLAHGVEFGMRPILATLPGGRARRCYVVVAHEEGARDLSSLRRGRLLGRHLAVESFARNVILGGQGAESLEIVFEKRTTSALRELHAGQALGLVVTDLEWEGIRKSERYGAGLRAIYTSESVPTELVVVFGDVDPGPFIEALGSMSGDPAGRVLLETMGNTGFDSLEPGFLERAVRAHDGPGAE